MSNIPSIVKPMLAAAAVVALVTTSGFLWLVYELAYELGQRMPH